jgi:type I restriction enzyme M protein
LFADFDVHQHRLGNNLKTKTAVWMLNIGCGRNLILEIFEENQIDLFGMPMSFSNSNYAANAGKSGGEFFTHSTYTNLCAILP